MTYSIDPDGNPPSVWRGLLAGAIGGLAGAYLMNQVHSAWSAVERELESEQREHDDPDGQGDSSEQSGGQSKDEPATTKAAKEVSEGVFDHPLDDHEKQVAGPAVHYAFGALMGGLYGAVVERQRAAAALGGMPFGTALWLVADEIGVPAAGLSGSSLETPFSSHVRALVAHLVYGLTTDAVRRGVRAVA